MPNTVNITVQCIGLISNPNCATLNTPVVRNCKSYVKLNKPAFINPKPWLLYNEDFRSVKQFLQNHQLCLHFDNALIQGCPSIYGSNRTVQRVHCFKL